MERQTTNHRSPPRWIAATISYAVASFAAGIALAAIESFADFIGGAPSATTIANTAITALLAGVSAGLNCALPAALVGLAFWWFRIGNLAAYVIAAIAIAGVLILSGFNFGFDEIGAVPAALVGALVFWACMRMAPRQEA